MVKVNEKLLKGMLNIVVLRLINEHGSIHGYEIIKKIRQRYGVYFSPSTIYPFLEQLEVKGYVKSGWVIAQATNRPIKTYTLTVKGKTELETSQTELRFIVMPLCTVQAVQEA
jgi:DNA-binding PadR family transcriptional regulator